MSSLKANDHLNVLGPLGNGFPIHDSKPIAWLVAGGVGLPPMLWLSEALRDSGKRTIAFCGTQSADLLPLGLNGDAPPATDASRATLCCREFARNDAPVVISTDDGSLGFHGHVGSAMAAYHQANPTEAEGLAVYTCGPERMMRFVADYCLARGIECHVCMERSMACGTGMCQSCVVPVHDEADPDGWCYRLCCTEGPVFDAASIIWEPAGGL
jgi:dihydroorotate dehydrogenase electron transfer subunit